MRLVMRLLVRLMKTGTRPIMHLGQVRLTVRLVMRLLVRLV